MLEKVDDKIIELISIENEKKALKRQLDELEAKEEELKGTILPEMKENEIKTFENEEIKITYIEATSRETIDSAKLKKDFPEIADKCRKNTPIKENWKITLKENK